MKKNHHLIKEFFYKAKNYLQTHRESKYLILLTIVLIIAICGFYIGSTSTSKSHMINNLQKAITSNNPKAMIKYITIENDAISLTEEKIQPFLDYLNNADGRVSQFISYLKSEKALEEDGMAVIKQINKGFLKSWKIELKPVYLHLSTKYKDTDFYIQGTSYGKSAEDNFIYKIGPLIPGKYNIKVKLSNEYGDSEAEKSVQLLEGTVATSLSPPAEYITLLSNFPEAELFINDMDTNLTIAEIENLGPVPMNSEIKIHGEMSFPWGTIKSDTKEIDDATSIRLDITPLNDTIKDQLEEEYKNFYYQLFEALNRKDLSLVEEPSRSAAKKIYDRYKSTALIFKDSYEIKEILWEESAVALKRENGTYIANAIVNLEYNKNKTILGFPINSKPDTLSFQTFLTYNPESNIWYVSLVNDLSK